MSASHFLWSIYNPLSATDGFFPSIPNFVSVHHILCRSVLFQLIYFDLLLLACVAIMNVENDEHHNQYQQFSLAAKKVGSQNITSQNTFQGVAFLLFASLSSISLLLFHSVPLLLLGYSQLGTARPGIACYLILVGYDHFIVYQAERCL